VDFRKGIDGLVALVAKGIKGNPYCGDIFVFRSKRELRLKILVFDGTGLILATHGRAWRNSSDQVGTPLVDVHLAASPFRARRQYVVAPLLCRPFLEILFLIWMIWRGRVGGLDPRRSRFNVNADAE
jgi:hypothetical protein